MGSRAGPGGGGAVTSSNGGCKHLRVIILHTGIDIEALLAYLVDDQVDVLAFFELIQKIFVDLQVGLNVVLSVALQLQLDDGAEQRLPGDRHGLQCAHEV